MVSYKYANLFEEDNVIKKWVIDYGGGTIENEDLDSQSIELTESLCSGEELRFGCCEAGCLKFKCANIAKTLKGLKLNVSVMLNDHVDEPFFVGRYKVESDKLTADRMHREVVAYDAMREMLDKDVSGWYNFHFREEDSSISVRALRISLAVTLGVFFKEQSLTNDNVMIEKTISPDKLSGKEVLSAICEINGCFCRIGRDGMLEFVYLDQDTMGLYPSETLYPGKSPDHLPQSKTGSLYPQEPDSFEIKRGCCISCQYEDYITKRITKLQIRQEENDAGVVFPEGEVSEDDNLYIVEGNFLLYGKNEDELKEIAQNIFSKITDIVYRPFNADVRGNLCLETGDAVRISTKYDIVESYILNRSIKGGQALRDNISSQGAEKYSAKANSIRDSIIQLKGKTNMLERDSEHTKETISDLEEGLRSEIEHTAKSFRVSITPGENGKTAELKLFLDEDGGTHYEVTSGTIEFNGLVSFKNLEDDGGTEINGGNLITGTVSCDVLDGGTINGQIFRGGKIIGATVQADSAYYLIDPDFGDKYRVAYIKATNTNETDIRFGRLSKNDFDSNYNYIAFREESQDRSFHVHSDAAYFHCPLYVNHIYSDGYLDFMNEKSTNGIRAYGSDGTKHFIMGYNPEERHTYVGMPANDSEKTSTRLRGNTVVLSSAGSVTVSDERVKNSFKPLDEFDGVYMDIEPCAFKYNDGTSGRFHFGTRAQGVKEALEKHGYTTKDFGGFVQMGVCQEGGGCCGVDDPMGVIYTEFVMWNMHMIQKQKKEIDFLRGKLDGQESRIGQLEKMVSLLGRGAGTYEQSI